MIEESGLMICYIKWSPQEITAHENFLIYKYKDIFVFDRRKKLFDEYHNDVKAFNNSLEYPVLVRLVEEGEINFFEMFEYLDMYNGARFLPEYMYFFQDEKNYDENKEITCLIKSKSGMLFLERVNIREYEKELSESISEGTSYL